MSVRKSHGYLTDIPVEEGQEVKEGDLLFSTDRRDVEVKQTQASATAKAAAGQVEAAKNAAEAAAASGGKGKRKCEAAGNRICKISGALRHGCRFSG